MAEQSGLSNVLATSGHFGLEVDSNKDWIHRKKRSRGNVSAETSMCTHLPVSVFIQVLPDSLQLTHLFV